MANLTYNFWKNNQDGGTPISAENLNAIQNVVRQLQQDSADISIRDAQLRQTIADLNQAIADLGDLSVDGLDTDKISQLQAYISALTSDSSVVDTTEQEIVLAGLYKFLSSLVITYSGNNVASIQENVDVGSTLITKSMIYNDCEWNDKPSISALSDIPFTINATAGNTNKFLVSISSISFAHNSDTDTINSISIVFKNNTSTKTVVFKDSISSTSGNVNFTVFDFDSPSNINILCERIKGTQIWKFDISWCNNYDNSIHHAVKYNTVGLTYCKSIGISAVKSIWDNGEFDIANPTTGTLSISTPSVTVLSNTSEIL